MKKVITYGTYDLLHSGHVKLLERAKKLGDYLIVGVTADDFDKMRGKINIQQSLMERVEAVRNTGIADEIIIEEYEGQKIDDIKRYGIDIFTIGSDWIGKFDYLNEYCKVVYLDRTKGISSSQLRSKNREIHLGLVGENTILEKYINECNYVNGIKIAGICSMNKEITLNKKYKDIQVMNSFENLLKICDTVCIVSHPMNHYQQIKMSLLQGKHVLCESPISLHKDECSELFKLAKDKNLVLMESIKTAYATAYNRLLLLIKSGRIGKVISVDATCTSLRDINLFETITSMNLDNIWNSICAWGPTTMLPIFQILGTMYTERTIITYLIDEEKKFDAFTKIDFLYSNAVASLKVGKGVKSEGNLIISGTKGYIYVPAPWWKTDYFEIRFENPEENKRYFYQLEGEGIRYEIVAFLKSIETGRLNTYIEEDISLEISSIIEAFMKDENLKKIKCI